MPEERSLGDGALGGRSRSNTGNVNASVGLRLDKSVARLWMTTYDDLTRKVIKLREEIVKLNNAASNTTRSIQGISSNGTNAATSTAGATNNAIVQSASMVRTPQAAGIGGAGGGAAAGGGGGAGAALAMSSPQGAAAAAAAKVIKSQLDKMQQAMAKLDARIDTGYSSSLVNDRQSVMYQQMYGISQQTNYNRFRQPINNFRLGPGGINEMLRLQANTGLNAQMMSRSVEAIRTISGFGLSTSDVNQMISTMASPEVNNRMTMTLGTGIYGPGGKQRSPMEVIQSIVRAAGLTNETVVKGALQPGSMTRARLTAMGVPEDMQDTVIQYAMQNIQYQKKTGGKQGMYNPGNRDQLRTMGIEGNLATEREVTDVRREQRSESFYNKQKDNYASMERNTQKMETLTTKIEDLTSAIIGARISTRGHPLTKALGKGFSSIMGPINDALSIFGGDPVEKGRGSKPITGGGSGGGSPNVPGNLNKTFGDRLRQMMAERPGITIGTGFRSSSAQRTMFLSRYSKTSEKTGVYWDGSYWKKHAGVPDAAPPGMSMHELGLAVDLDYPTKADEEWFMRNASRFGLKTIASIDEPWHVQPAELPNSRRKYEEAGAPWGRGPAGTVAYPYDATFEGTSKNDSYTSSGVAVNSQLSIADSIAYDRATNRMRLGGGGAGGRMVTLRTGSSSAAGTGTSKSPATAPKSGNIPAGFKYRTTPNYDGWGYFVPQTFTDADLEQLHLHEQKDWTRTVKNRDGTLMGGFAMNQFNWNRGGGLAFAKNPALATPADQKKVAKVLLEQFHAHDGFESIVRGNISWPGVGKLKSVDLPPGTPRSTTHSSSSNREGDPLNAPSRVSSNTVIVDGGGGGITIAPNIYIQSAGNHTADARRVAQEVADIVTRRVKTAALRGM